MVSSLFFVYAKMKQPLQIELFFPQSLKNQNDLADDREKKTDSGCKKYNTGTKTSDTRYFFHHTDLFFLSFSSNIVYPIFSVLSIDSEKAFNRSVFRQALRDASQS